jgi:hypothetical protein
MATGSDILTNCLYLGMACVLLLWLISERDRHV